MLFVFVLDLELDLRAPDFPSRDRLLDRFILDLDADLRFLDLEWLLFVLDLDLDLDLDLRFLDTDLLLDLFAFDTFVLSLELDRRVERFLSIDPFPRLDS